MKAVLIDDEPLPLMKLAEMLEADAEGVEVIATYHHAVQALEDIPGLAPDVVFVDIHMPQMDGLKLATAIQEALPQVNIVFVTAYDRYAVQAFDLFALDYIVKPLRPDRLRKTVERLKQRVPVRRAAAERTEGALLRCFRRITVQLPGCEREPIKWRTAKVQELFAYLLHHRGRPVYRETLVDLLWPDFEPARGAQHLYTAIYHMRHTLQGIGLGAISIVGGKQLSGSYSMKIGDSVRVDVLEWEQRLKRLSAPEAGTIAGHEALLDEYEGDYFGEYEYMWAEGERERLRRLWLNHAKHLTQFYRRTGNVSSAIRVYRHIQRQLPLEEDSYWELMKLYALAERPLAVEEQYGLLCSVLEQELDMRPSAAVTAWYEQWKEQAAAPY